MPIRRAETFVSDWLERSVDLISFVTAWNHNGHGRFAVGTSACDICSQNLRRQSGCKQNGSVQRFRSESPNLRRNHYRSFDVLLQTILFAINNFVQLSTFNRPNSSARLLSPAKLARVASLNSQETLFSSKMISLFFWHCLCHVFDPAMQGVVNF
jgi:hypothetical protein